MTEPGEKLSDAKVSVPNMEFFLRQGFLLNAYFCPQCHDHDKCCAAEAVTLVIYHVHWGPVS